MARNRCVLENQHGAVVRRVERAERERMLARGEAFMLPSGRLRLADKRHVGSGMDKRTSPGIGWRQVVMAACARDTGSTPAENYAAARVEAFREVAAAGAPMAVRA